MATTPRVLEERSDMMTMTANRVIDERTGHVVATAVRTTDGFIESFLGLMFKKGLPDGHGLLFKPARGIHTHFMRFPIDLIYLDKANRVVKIRAAMRPWRFDFTSAAGVVELTGGTAAAQGIKPGDQLRFEPANR